MGFDDRTRLRHSYKQEVLEVIPSAVCKRVQVFSDLAGYYIYKVKPNNDEEIRSTFFACAGRAEDAWAKAASKIKRLGIR